MGDEGAQVQATGKVISPQMKVVLLAAWIRRK